MKKRDAKQIGLLLVWFFTTVTVKAQQTAEKFIQETQYLLFLPDYYAADTAKRWPILLFLHGSGESGTELNKVRANGPPKLVEAGRKFPFIVVSPQAPPQTGWKPDLIKAMLDDLKKKYRIDPDRVYLTGLSMGGFGTWELSEKYPDEFAAIVPICGGGDPQKTWKLRHMPVWCFHGAKDNTVPIAASQIMVDALKKYNPSVRFTIYPEANHNSWDTTYNNDSLYSWLLTQKKFRYTAITIPVNRLKEYEGFYVNVKKDTLQIVLENEKLIAKPGRNTIELKASATDHFYWDPNSINELEFLRDKKGSITGLSILTDEKEEASKIPFPTRIKK